MRFNIFIPYTLLPGLRGLNRLASGSLRTVATLLVRIQAEQEVRDLVLVRSTFLYHVHYFRVCAG